MHFQIDRSTRKRSINHYDFFLQFECYFLTCISLCRRFQSYTRGQKITELLLLSEKFANFKKTDTKVRSILIQRIICVECTLQLFKFTCLSLANFGVLFFISTTYTRHISQQHWSLIQISCSTGISSLLISESDVIISSKADNYFH